MKSFRHGRERRRCTRRWRRARGRCRTPPRHQRAVHLADHGGDHRGDPVRDLQRGAGRRSVVQAGVRGPGPCRRGVGAVDGVLRASSTTSAAASAARRTSARCCRCCPRTRSPRTCSARLTSSSSGTSIVLAMGLARAVQAAHAADRDFAARVLRGHRAGDRHRQEPGWRRMSRNKKILIGVGIVVVLGRDRVRQLQVQAAGRHRGQRRGGAEARPAGDRVRLGQDPAAAAGQHQRRHDGPRHRPARRGRPARAEGGLPPADRSAQPDDRLQPDAGVARGVALDDGAAARRRSTAPGRR